MPLKKGKGTGELIRKQVLSSGLRPRVAPRSSADNKLQTSLPPVRIASDHKKRLEAHLKQEKGLSLSSGVRMILFDYMKQNNLI